MGTELTGHARIDRRSLEMHRAIAEKLRNQPALMEIAWDNLNRWLASGGHSQPYFEAWREILGRPLPEVLELLIEESEKMTSLRQNAPFAGVLTPAERWGIYERFEQRREASAGE